MKPEAFLSLLAQALGCLLDTREVAISEPEVGKQWEYGVWHTLPLK